MVFTSHHPEEEVPLADVLSLEKVDDSKWRSLHGTIMSGKVPYKGKLRPAALGGCVLGQAAWAAAQSVPMGYVLNNVTAHWTAPARPDYPAFFSVRSVQDGKSIRLRYVEVTQEGTDGSCFNCTCSFKRPEPDAYEYQVKFDMMEKYKSVLQGELPQHYPASTLDISNFLNAPTRQTKAGVGWRIGRVPMDAYNRGRLPEDRRQLYPYNWIQPDKLPAFHLSPNLHIAGHLYCCDRESARTPAIHLGQVDNLASVSSLAVTVIVHATTDVLAGCDAHGEPRWFYQEVSTDRAAEGRSVSHSKIYDEQGRHLITTIQDCALRLQDGETRKTRPPGLEPRL